MAKKKGKKGKPKKVATNKYEKFSRAPSTPGGQLKRGLQGNKRKGKGKSTTPAIDDKPTVDAPEVVDIPPKTGSRPAEKPKIIVPERPKVEVPPVHVAHPSGSSAILVGEFDEKLW